MEAKEKYIPCGIVDEVSGSLYIEFGRSYKTNDFIADVLSGWWDQLSPAAQQAMPLIQLKVDNGPESSGVRTQFLNRMVAWVDHIGKPLQLLYFPPYHSKYNPIVGADFPKGTLLGHPGAALEWLSTHQCPDDAGLGAEYDLEREPTRYPPQLIALSKRDLPVQTGHGSH